MLPALALADARGGGGEVPGPTGPCLTDSQRQAIQERIHRNVQWLEEHGRLAKPVPNSRAVVAFGWPLQQVVGSDPGYHGISNFVDQDRRFPGFLLDYHCGARTYDQTSGYNHQGTDFYLWPFGWLTMRDSRIAIIAAEAGTIVDKSDGYPDQSCAFNDGKWNAVYVRHVDGSTAWYGHMKTGSTTTKAVGDTVARGERLGFVGSSGNSTGPHLHFEVYDSAGHLIDPFQGPCNSLNRNTWWQNQKPYYDSAINHLGTGTAPPEFPACPGIENPHEQETFTVGSTIFFVAYYRDQLSSQLSQNSVLRPDGSVFASWQQGSNAAHYKSSYWYQPQTIPPEAPLGRWHYRVVFQGQTVEIGFTVQRVQAPPDEGSGGCGSIGPPPDPPVQLGQVILLGAVATFMAVRSRRLAGRSQRRVEVKG